MTHESKKLLKDLFSFLDLFQQQKAYDKNLRRNKPKLDAWWIIIPKLLFALDEIILVAIDIMCKLRLFSNSQSFVNNNRINIDLSICLYKL